MAGHMHAAAYVNGPEFAALEDLVMIAAELKAGVVITQELPLHSERFTEVGNRCVGGGRT